MVAIIHTEEADSAAVNPSWFLGASLQSIEFLEPCDWRFIFSSEAFIRTDCLWRLVGPEGIVVTSEDHLHKFGLPVALDAGERAAALIVTKAVSSFALREDTRDLLFGFSNGYKLEFLATSAGYESWQITSPQHHQVIAQGGGKLCTYAK
jgi:hypothetical protein